MPCGVLVCLHGVVQSEQWPAIKPSTCSCSRCGVALVLAPLPSVGMHLLYCCCALTAFTASVYPLCRVVLDRVHCPHVLALLCFACQVVFLQPVDVGDLVHLEACVLYTKAG